MLNILIKCSSGFFFFNKNASNSKSCNFVFRGVLGLQLHQGSHDLGRENEGDGWGLTTRSSPCFAIGWPRDLGQGS